MRETVCKQCPGNRHEDDSGEPADEQSREQPLALAFGHAAQTEEHEPEDTGQDSKSQSRPEVDLVPDHWITKSR